ncbi:MAG TPA: aldo/keto reductase [Bryobacteraceae bacterium]|nr:aldo/keto reductase [Bryobacteraceae bacterium]
MDRTVILAPDMPEVCRLGLATRGGSGSQPADIACAIERGVNYLNWCGHPDGLSRAIAQLGAARSKVVVAVQFQSRNRCEAASEFEFYLEQLRTDYIDIATLYYVESSAEWDTITAPDGTRKYLQAEKQAGRLRLIGLTTHQRPLAANWAQTGLLDMLMVRYNAAHRGAEDDLFPVTSPRRIPVVTFTGLRWGALLKPTPDDPPGFRPPTPADCYRFCLANRNVAVALMAPANRGELENDLKLLEDWRAPTGAEMVAIRAHGERVRRHAGTFW